MADTTAFAAVFEDVYRTHYAALCRFAATIVGTRDAAKDVVQQVFTQLWERGPEATGPDALVPYLFRATRHRALDAAKHDRVVERWRGSGAGDATVASGGADRPGAGPLGIDQLLERDERLARVYEAIAALPERSRQVLILRWQAHLEYPEIARVLGIAPASAKMLHSRALDAVRRRLGPDFG